MASTFLGISIATSGLISSQAGLAVSSNNISNVNTAGYSQQTVSQTAVSPAAVYTAAVGGGSQITAISQVREARLDQKYWRENTSVGEWETKTNILSELETILDELSGDGLTSLMEEFYAALSDLSGDAGSDSARSVVQQTGSAICAYLNSMYRELTDYRVDLNLDIKTTVTSITSYAEQIAVLNQQIQLAAATGANAGELRDQRTLLIDKLSQLTDVEVGETVIGTNANGSSYSMLTISINGELLVNGGKTRTLIADAGGDPDGMVSISWQDTGDSFTPGGGSLKAYLELRDGNGTGTEAKGIPYYIEQLNTYARTFAEAFNEGLSGYCGHADGVGADGTTEVRFFSFDGKSSADLMASGTDTAAVYANITAGNISLTSDVSEDARNIAAASAAGEAGNNENSNDLLSICRDTKMFSNGSPLDFINSVVTTLGNDSLYAQRLAAKHTTVLTNIETRRNSVSGVSTNEETVNLTKYQQAYEASAKILSVWDEVYKTTINMVNS